MIIDEMDTMLEKGFQGDLGKLLHPMLYRKKVVEMEEYKNGKLTLVEGAPQVILTTENSVAEGHTRPDRSWPSSSCAPIKAGICQCRWGRQAGPPRLRRCRGRKTAA